MNLMALIQDERKPPDWKEQTWRVGDMLHVGLTDSHVHEGLRNGVVVGHIVVFWHQRQKSSPDKGHA